MDVMSKLRLSELVGSRTLRLAVTGLSRSGKTVFLTSLIHNLLSATASGRMPLLRAVPQQRLVAVERVAPVAQSVRLFRYGENLAAMAAQPAQWPQGTDDVRTLELALRFRWGGLVAGLGAGHATLKLDITDYPGEWLIDVPMLSLSFNAWSEATLERCRRPARAGLAAAWLAYIEAHPGSSPEDGDVAKTAHDLYRRFLKACKDSAGLSYLQPGRFLLPGDKEDLPLLWFCPLAPTHGGDAAPRPGTLAALMAQRFEAYKHTLVEGFFREHFRHVDRQIVLVDVLRALNAGPEAFEDIREAVGAVMEMFRYGNNGLLSRLFGARVDRVLFAATKADYVTASQRDSLRALLLGLVRGAGVHARARDAFTEAIALAAVQCTRDDTDTIEGRKVEVVVGTPVGTNQRVKFYPGVIPLRPPALGAWNEPFHAFPEFQPPSFDLQPVDGIPHINMDEALDYLIGDYLV